ncbi:P-loop containing nucleoside triphosphate hydrolase protein [Suillus fuscotomentosus]|uniref:P-loop containing nucleoside triphosphate hydrolase protein n=1 Tax=Suillus fuscotomentosus TaxID=1912939 RepID=A0AAD4EM16_9AGAM|nr:P-loop containing nucleoside triphosphate hydrolase protein [Suillus fuscotomentosus]KAG1908571.1 P-loop containing nucleoside triphosphate hydrolase protein [Suillus fuscotomentosus]
MGTEPTLLVSHTSEGLPATADEKKLAVSKELTPPEHVTLDMKKDSKGIRGFLPWAKKASKEMESEADNAMAADRSVSAPFLSLFRYSTRFEIMLDFLGMIFAVAAGASQPLMTLVFGDMTQDFVTFNSAENEYYQSLQSNDTNVIEQAQAALDAAASTFVHSASLDASYLVYLGIAMFVSTYIYMYTWVYTSEANGKRIRERYLQAILRQEIAYFDDVGAGEVATRIQTDTHLVQLGISEKVTVAVTCISSFVVGFIIAFVRSWRLALALSSMIVCIIIIGGVMKKCLSKYTQLSLKHVAEAGSLAEEVISTIRTAQAFGTQKVLSGIYDKNIDVTRVVNAKASISQGVGLGCLFFVNYAGYALAFEFGTTLINEGQANAGQVVNVFFAILTGSLSLAILAPELQAITRACGAAVKLFATIERVPDIDSANPGGLKPSKVTGEITFKEVKFSYPSRADVPILKGIDITFPAGKTTALVGASGSGKSTIVSLTERFYDPLSGSVTLDGIDLRELNTKWLRSQIGLVSQEPVLFATTIRGNIAHGLIGTQYEDASDEEKFQLIKAACIKSNADSFISHLPQGYGTMVGERGFLLSGGQKQRIAIARAIVSDPRILLLDEATSALDTRSEVIVQDALDKAAAGRTTITIAHRLSTVKDADCILVMGEGLVLERGTHAELLADENGAYSRLVAAQSLRESDKDDLDAGVSGDESDLERSEEVLERKSTIRSVRSDVASQLKENVEDQAPEEAYGLFYLMRRIASLHPEGLRRYFIGSFFAICNGAAYPVSGIIYGHAVSGFSATTNSERSYQGDRNALWFFILAILCALCMGFQNYFFASAAAVLTAKLRSMSFKAILRQDIEYFDNDKNSTGTLTSNLSENPQRINGLAGITLGTIIQSIATLVVGLVIGFAYAWKAAIVGMACIPVLVCGGYIRLQVVVLKDQRNKKAQESSAQIACEAAAAIRTVASLTREEHCLDMYRRSLEGPIRKSTRTALWSHLLYALAQAMGFWVISLVVWYGATLVSQLEISTQSFFITLVSTVFSSMQAGNIFAFVPDISSAKGAADATIRLLDSTPAIDAESTEGKSIPSKTIKGHIQLENVHFSYPTRPRTRVLRGLTLTVEPGTYVALVGSSGCGKSTVIQLLERFYDPLSGQISLDGELIDEYNIQAYRQQISLVSQEPTLYAGTIRFNILLGATRPESEVTQEEIEAACRDANILEFVQSLPDGFNTEVGGKGSQLSGGQKQRIAIARALLRNPKVLLLDEATSALDSNSEKVVQEALDKAAKGRTTIAIAHRLSTIQNADCIHFVKEGRVSESGSHDELLARRGDYYEFVQLQALSKK